MGFLENLPEEIIHLILSFLKPIEAARTSSLCNIWFRAWQTQPNLEQNEKYFRRRERFVDYTDSSPMRYQEMKISIEKLELCLWPGSRDRSQHLDNWIEIAINIGLKRRGAGEIFSICQNIEFLNLDRVLTANQGKLKVRARNLKELKVVAPSLEVFTGTTKKEMVAISRETVSFSLETTQNTKFLRLRQISVSSPIKEDQFPKLEDLTMEFCYIRHMHLSNQLLKNLTVRFPSDLEYLRVDCSDKFQFQFYSNMNFIPKIVFTNPSRHSVY